MPTGNPLLVAVLAFCRLIFQTLLVYFDRFARAFYDFRRLRLYPFLGRVVEKLQGWAGAAWSRLRAPLDFLRRIARGLLGDWKLSYESPAWGARAARVGEEAAGNLREYERKHPSFWPRMSALIVLVWFAIPGGVLCLFLGTDARTVGFQVEAPGIPEFRPGAAPTTLSIEFEDSVAPLASIGYEIKKGVRLKPEIAGSWAWQSERRLVFTPRKHWPPGAEYRIVMDKELTPPEVRLSRSSSREFTTPAFSMSLARLEFRVDYRKPADKRVYASVRFNYPVDPGTFPSRVTLREKGRILPRPVKARDYKFTIKYNKDKTEAYIVSENLRLRDEDYSLDLSVEPGAKTSFGGYSTKSHVTGSAVVQGLGNFFAVTGVETAVVKNRFQGMERVIVVNTRGEARAETIGKGLQVYLLPRDLKDVPGRRDSEKHDWSPEDVGPAALRKSTLLKAQSIPGEREFATSHTFRITAPANRYVYVKVRKGLENYAGYYMREGFQSTNQLERMPRLLKIMHEGALLSLRGEKKISVTANNVDEVNIEVQRILPTQINHLVSQTGGDFKSPRFTNYNFSGANIAKIYTEKRRLVRAKPGRMQYFTCDLSRYLNDPGGRTGLFLLRVRDAKQRRPNPRGGDGDDPDGDEPGGGGDYDDSDSETVGDRRFVLVTDLGFLVKKSADGREDVFVKFVSSGRPAADVLVRVLGKNGVPIARARTDGSGRARLPSLKSFRREKAPTAYLLKKGNDISFMPYERYDRVLNYSRFDTGGITSSADALQAYLFSDRGLYRPGDELRAGIIVKPGSWARPPAGLPLELSLLDARGLEIRRKRVRLPASGVMEFKYGFSETAPTGQYSLRIHTVKDNRRHGLLGSMAVRVEEFQPDRMKIRAEIEGAGPAGWVTAAELRGKVDLRHLYGKPADDHRVTGRIIFDAGNFYFRGYRDYVFFNASRAERNRTTELTPARTDENGQVEFDLSPADVQPATYRMTLFVRGYEKTGGRSVSAATSVLVSPLKYVLGYKADGNLHFMRRNSSRSVRLLALDSKLRRVKVGKLKAVVTETRWTSALIKDDDGAYRYSSVRRDIKRDETEISVSKNGLRYRLDTRLPGAYTLEIRDEDNLVLHKVEYTVVGAANLAGRLEKDAELTVRLNKNDYRPGELVKLSVLGPYKGAGLITIERDRVYAHKWFRTNTNSTVTSIRVPRNLEGNAYINVSFIRSINSREIHTSPLAYSVQPFTISRERRLNRIRLKIPEKARPGKLFPIQYSSSRPGKIFLFAVDEGILQAAAYRKPDPLAWFFRKRALTVGTRQILDLILPEHSIVRRVSRFGGGGDAALKLNLNPFKRKDRAPVTYWSGVLNSDSRRRTVYYKVPRYFNGTLRVIAVAAGRDAVGAEQKRAFIRDHFIITPSVPRFIAPGDQAEIPVTVYNNLPVKSSVRLTVASEKGLKLSGDGAKALVLKPKQEISTSFRVRGGDSPSAAALTFRAQGNGKESFITENISVRPVTPFRVTLKSGIMTKESRDILLERDMFEQFRERRVDYSRLPLGLARGLLRFLEKTSYGTTEQLVSGVFPLMLLRERPEFRLASAGTNARIYGIIRILRTRQNDRGGFGRWTGNNSGSDWHSVYTMHFLTEAGERGYGVPEEMKKRGLEYLRGILRRNGALLRTRAYAAYVLARNDETDAAALRELLRLNKEDSHRSGDLATVYLAGALKLLKKDDEARKLMAAFDPDQDTRVDYNFYYDALVRNSQYMYVLGREFPKLFKRIEAGRIVSLIRPLRGGYLNSLSASYAVLALMELTKLPLVRETRGVNVSRILAEDKLEKVKPGRDVLLQVPLPEIARGLRIENESSLPLFYQALESGFDRKEPAAEIRDNIEIHRDYLDAKGKLVANANVGDAVTVRLRLRTLDRSRRSNVAVVDILPGGFEPVRESIRSRPDGKGWRIEHADIREDRVILHGDVTGSVREFTYKIRAVNRGRYRIPPAYANSMYDPKTRAYKPFTEYLEILGEPVAGSGKANGGPGKNGKGKKE